MASRVEFSVQTRSGTLYFCLKQGTGRSILLMWQLVILVATILASGCATLQRPRGNWLRPVSLNIPDDALKDLRVQTQCFSADDDGRNPQIDHADVCSDLRKVVASMGGVALDPSVTEPQGAPHFFIRYTELPGQRDFCGWTLAPFILSFTLFPCIEDLEVHATIGVHDDRGQLSVQQNLDYEQRSIRGIPALAMLALKPLRSEGSRKERIASALVQTVKNTLYSYVQTRPDYADRLVKSF